jgi:hypothetical protein
MDKTGYLYLKIGDWIRIVLMFEFWVGLAVNFDLLSNFYYQSNPIIIMYNIVPTNRIVKCVYFA